MQSYASKQLFILHFVMTKFYSLVFADSSGPATATGERS